jgi:hypothetical protein
MTWKQKSLEMATLMIKNNRATNLTVKKHYFYTGCKISNNLRRESGINSPGR